MIGYPYIQTLFQTILNHSIVVQGNFFVCPKWGSELTNPNITEALPIGGKVLAAKYPAAMLMPPYVDGNFEYQGQAGQSGTILYDTYRIKLLFLGGTFNTGNNQPMQPNAGYATTHTIVDTQHDMMRVAKNFIAKLFQTLQASGVGIINDVAKERITFVANIGPDEAAGVLLDFQLCIFSGCTIEDYASPAVIVAPSLTDSHPLHTM